MKVRVLNESVSESDIRREVTSYFDYRGSDDFFDVACDIVERVDDYSDSDSVWEAVDEGLIYIADQWAVYMHYCQPGDPWDECLEEFTNDIMSICSNLEDEDDEEEGEE